MSYQMYGKMEHKMNNVRQSVYNTFPEMDEMPNSQGIAKACILTFVIGLLLIQLATNAIGLHIGVTYNNATCYEDKFVMSLSSWLTITTSVAITGTSLMIIFSLIQFFCGNEKTILYGCISFAVYSVIVSLFYSIMTIIGIIELSFQFAPCHTEVKYVTVMTIIIVVVNLLSILSACTLKSS